MQQTGVSWLIGCMLIAGMQCGGGHASRAVQHKIQSVTLDARHEPPAGMLPALAEMGVTHITLITFAYQRHLDEPALRMRPDADWYSESDHGIRALAQGADTLGMRIIIKPHIWVGRYSAEGQTRADIGFATEAAWQQWEAQYRTFLMHYARLAEEIDAAMLVVGTELYRSVRERPAFWRALIAEIHAVYGGPLTYAANWWEEYEAVSFWDALDWIGIQGYFELSRAENPSRAVLLEGWALHKAAIEALARREERPVLFTELGYRNVADAAARPWRWPTYDATEVPADSLQAMLFDVFFETLWHEPWFDGVILWKWRPQQGRRRNGLDFSPQGKPAEAVIRRWFAAGVH